MGSPEVQISDAEWVVMEAAWVRGGQAAGEIVAAVLEARDDWSHRTVRTLLARLVEKGAIGIRRDENRFLYTPLVSKEAYTRTAAKAFKEKYFGGDTKALLLHFALTGGISEDEFQELRKAVRSKRGPAKAKSRRG